MHLMRTLLASALIFIFSISEVFANSVSGSNAVAGSRFHHQWQPNSIRYESGSISTRTLDKLKEMGHVGFGSFGYSTGDANSIMQIGDLIHGVSDPGNSGGAVAW